ncbi:hypothetical protein HELRODRAFT_175916 [Helobdella robusta]|uniref:Uncharacterized protein n=1 Tax=Helobdella robusta TaxID=6412 RepID=T1F9V9_HELRO|nr:hypothetical protein HELRODRAFT_175916 [Helobdella robusta]ESO00476.1 hypothetical protein HELRODRAFT_175916 [Helobdella robusta]
MDTVLSTVHCLSQELQKSNIDYVAASGLIQACKATFTKFRSDEYLEEIAKQTDKLCDMIGVAPQEEKNLRNSTGCTEMHRSSAPAKIRLFFQIRSNPALAGFGGRI